MINYDKLEEAARHALRTYELDSPNKIAWFVRYLMDELEGDVDDDVLRPASRTLDFLITHLEGK